MEWISVVLVQQRLSLFIGNVSCKLLVFFLSLPMILWVCVHHHVSLSATSKLDPASLLSRIFTVIVYVRLSQALNLVMDRCLQALRGKTPGRSR